AGTRFVQRRLGKGLANIRGKAFTRAHQAVYVDVTALGRKHRYYLRKNVDSDKHPAIRAFFDRVLNGLPPHSTRAESSN
ncbi:MAG: hypothetical protein AAF492_07130, partial [Verrucomicrobiota bacterium]